MVGTLFFFTTAFYVTFSFYQQQGLGTDPLHTGLAILPYGAGLFIGPLVSAPLVARLGHALLPIGMGIQVAGYGATGLAIWYGFDGWPVFLAVLVAGFGQGIALPRLYNAALGDVPPQQAGVAAAVINSALQIGGAVSVAAVGSLFFTVLGGGTGHAAYAHAFGIAQAATTLALFASMLLSISSRTAAQWPARRPGDGHERSHSTPKRSAPSSMPDGSVRPRSSPRPSPPPPASSSSRCWTPPRCAPGRGCWTWPAAPASPRPRPPRVAPSPPASISRPRCWTVRAAAHPAITFLQGDAEALPCADATFDAVVANFGVHHVPRPPLALAEAFRVLAAGRPDRRQLLGRTGAEHRMEAAVGRGAAAWRRCCVRGAAAGGRFRLGAADPGCAARRRIRSRSRRRSSAGSGAIATRRAWWRRCVPAPRGWPR